MAGRGSGIGLSFQGGIGTSNGATVGGARAANAGMVYGTKSGGGMAAMKTHHWLWVLVALEMGFLLFLRLSVFRRYHGG